MVKKKNKEELRLPRCDIIIEKRGDCGFCGGTKVALFGLKVVIPVPNCKQKKAVCFLCECCIRNYLGRIQDKSYMTDYKGHFR